jgi:hypothetical protein
VPLADLKFLYEFSAGAVGTSNRAARVASVQDRVI